MSLVNKDFIGAVALLRYAVSSARLMSSGVSSGGRGKRASYVGQRLLLFAPLLLEVAVIANNRTVIIRLFLLRCLPAPCTWIALFHAKITRFFDDKLSMNHALSVEGII